MIWEIVLLFWITFSVQGYPSGAISEQKVTIHHLVDTEKQKSNDGQNKNEYHEEYASADPSYEFSYKVSDPDTKDFKGQHETRHKDKVNGLYWLVEPYGQKRTVEYRSEGKQGFKAHVSYTPSNDIVEGHHNNNHDKNEHEKNTNDEKIEHGKSISHSKEEHKDEGGDDRNHNNGGQHDSNENKNKIENKHKPNHNGGQRRMFIKHKQEEQLINAAEQSEERKEDITNDQEGKVENDNSLEHLQHHDDHEIKTNNFHNNDMKNSKHNENTRNIEAHEKPNKHGHRNGHIENVHLEANSQENKEANEEKNEEMKYERNNENDNENNDEYNNSQENGGIQNEKPNESNEMEEDAHHYCNKKKNHKENTVSGANRRRAINYNNSKNHVRNIALSHKAVLRNINIQHKSDDEEKFEHHIIVHHPQHVAHKSKH